MRNPILAVAIAFVFAAPCIALAQSNDRIWHKHIGGVKYEDAQTQPKAPTTGKPLNTTVNPALQGNVLKKGTGGSTGSKTHIEAITVKQK
jgi:hypothetical protein